MQILRRLFRTWWSAVLRLAGRRPRHGRARSLDQSAVSGRDVDSVNMSRKAHSNGCPPIYFVFPHGVEGERERRLLGSDEHLDKHKTYEVEDNQDDELSRLAIRLELERQWRLHGSDDKDKWTNN